MKFLFLALKYFPYVIQGVVAVEAAIDAPGATKKKIILDSVMAAAQIGGTVPEAHVAAISKLIDTAVGTLNVTGVFDKPTAAVAATAGK